MLISVLNPGDCEEGYDGFPTNTSRQLAGTQAEIHGGSTRRLHGFLGFSLLLRLAGPVLVEEARVTWKQG